MDYSLKQEKSNVTYLVQLALMVAIIIIMSVTPLGYLKIGALAITFLTVPVAIGAMTLGPVGGLICGLTFGLSSFLTGFLTPTPFSAALIEINVVGYFITTVVARTLEGLLVGLIFKALRKIKLNKNFCIIIGSLLCPVLNTVLFMGSLVIFFYNSNFIQTIVKTGNFKNPFFFVIGFVGIQGLIEAIVCTVVASAVTLALSAALHNTKSDF